MWFKDSNCFFYKTENFAYGEINERNFSNPHPWSFELLYCITSITLPLRTDHHSITQVLRLTYNGKENISSFSSIQTILSRDNA